MAWPFITDSDVLVVRPAKNRLDPWRPYAFLVESERSSAGTIDDCLTIFLTNRECVFRCTMCDLWRNTLDERVPLGAIPAQIDHAILNSPAARHVKLYNAGNFFDSQAIPPEDHSEIISRVRTFETVIVENHPRLTDDRCIRFRDQLETRLEIALGLETIHPAILASLNKRMTVVDFDTSVRFLLKHQIAVRSFLLLKPPGFHEDEGIDWAIRSLRHAVEVGVSCVSFIPTRGGNGIMEQIAASGDFSSPTIRSMELVLEAGLQYVSRSSPATRVFMDVWDDAAFYLCSHCGPARSKRIERMNVSQQMEPAVNCDHCGNGGSI
jgi:radical SAM enzyme (TIGR01210 family)